MSEFWTNFIAGIAAWSGIITISAIICGIIYLIDWVQERRER